MIRLGVIFGGRSCEHDVSIITGQQLIQNVDKSKYQVVPIYISREGRWYTGEKLLDTEFMSKFNPDSVNEVYMSATSGEKCLYAEKQQKKGFFSSETVQEKIPVDVAILSLHGLHGEDGTVQGLLELNGIPYGGTGVMGCSVGMDKIAMKAVFRGYGFPVLDDIYAERNEYKNNQDAVLNEAEEKIGYPMFVKPANLGSSIGISKAKDRQGLKQALEIAFSYDRRVLIEKGVVNLDEVNCSCLGYSNDVTASVCEMPVTFEDMMLSFDDKYMRGGKGKGMQALTRKIPAPISEEKTKEIQELSVKIFKALDCKGVVRIDYLLDKDLDKVFVGEINIIPGSFSFYLWEPTGLKYSELIDKLVDYAFKAKEESESNNYAYDSEILTKVSIKGTKGSKMHGTKT